MFRSSTSSFDRRSLVLSLRTLALTLALIGAAEAAARLALRPIGDYWKYWTPEAASKFESYRSEVRKGSVPEVVIVGDSTAARNIDPRFLDPLGFNLATPANFPIAFEQCTLPLLRQSLTPRVVIASFSPHAFADTARVQRFEESIMSSPFCRRLQGQRTASDVSALARVRLALPFRRSWWTGKGLPPLRYRGFMPLRGTETDPSAVGDEPATFSERRFAAVVALFDAARDHHFSAIVLVPPRRNPSPQRLRIEQAYIDHLRTRGLPFLDYREAATTAQFFDDGHLNDVGADAFSRLLAVRVARLRDRTRDDAAGAALVSIAAEQW